MFDVEQVLDYEFEESYPESWEDDWDDYEMGFDPYEGSYTYDC